MNPQDAQNLFRVLLDRDITAIELEFYARSDIDLAQARSLLIESPDFRARWFPGPSYRAETAPGTLIKRSESSLALAAIVKDEAHRIGDMLRSCAPIVDYVVLNDTGSHDDTIAVARNVLTELGLAHEIIQTDFTHFSQARNDALVRVPARIAWVLMLDADERLVPEDYQKLLDLLSTEQDGWRLPRFNFRDADKQLMPLPYPDYQARLFRNRPANPRRFIGAVHEIPIGAETWPAAATSDSHYNGPSGGPHIHHMSCSTTSPERLRDKGLLYEALTHINQEVVVAQVAAEQQLPPEAKQQSSEVVVPPIDAKDYMQHSYSQCGEDIFLVAAFFQDKRDGFYVDVGAHHPYRISNTALFHERGWHGINIDVDERAIAAFLRCRPGDINILSGVASDSGIMELHLFGEGAVNTLSPSLAEEYEKIPGRKIIEVKPVQVHPLWKILDENLPDGQQIDLMNIDVEGLDNEVLRSNNWDKYRPVALLVEIHNATIYNILNHPTTRYLADQGYEVAGILALTTIFRRTR